MAHKDDADVARLLAAADTKLGIIAGLTLAVASTQKRGDSDDDGNAHSTSGSPTSGPHTTQQPQLADAAGDAFQSGKPAGKKGLSGNQSAPVLSSVQEQREAIRRLQEHNQLLRAELAIEQRDARALVAVDKRARVSELQRTASSFARKIALAQKKLALTEQQVQSKQQELGALRQKRLQQYGHGDSTSKDANVAASSSEPANESGGASVEPSAAGAARRVRALENRLELSLVKKNEIESVNKHLFSLIDKVRRDRVIFDGIYKKLEREASDSRQRHSQHLAELERVRAARLGIAREIESVQFEAEEEQRAFEQEFQDLKRDIETWMREHSYEPEVLPLEDISGGQIMDDTLMSKAGSVNKKNALTRVAARSTWKIGVDRALNTGADALVARYDRAFEEIRNITGLNDTRALCEELLARDEANFQRFRRVEELSREQVALQAQIAEISAQMEEFKAREGIASVATQKQEVKTAQRRLAALVDSNQELEMEAEALQSVFARVKSSVHSVHNLLVHSAGGKGSGSSNGSGAGAGSGATSSSSGSNNNGGSSGNNGSANATAGGSATSMDTDWMQLGGTSLPLSAREVTEANVLEYLRAIETYASRLMLQSSLAAATNSSDTDGSGEPAGASTISNAGVMPQARSADAMPPPLGLGPATLPFDQNQKLQVQVPSFGGINGSITLPPPLAQPPSPVAIAISGGQPDTISRSQTNRPLALGQQQSLSNTSQQQQLSPQQQMLHHNQRKRSSKFELYSRKSLSQQQFAAALAAAAATTGCPEDESVNSSLLTTQEQLESSPPSPMHFQSSAPSEAEEDGQQDVDDGEEEERALTYEELRRFAAKNLMTRHRTT